MHPNWHQGADLLISSPFHLGTIISKSCLPESELGSYDFFEQPSKQPPSVHNGTEARIWSGLEIVHEIGHEIFHSLLKMNNEVKHLTLTWIGDCFHANVGRGKMWTREMGPLLANSLASDGCKISNYKVIFILLNIST